MSRLEKTLLALSLASLLAPGLAHSAEWGEAAAGEAPLSRDAGDVSVDIEGSTAGPTAETFRSTLTPYGDWYSSTRYGSVWRPRVAAGWRPYYYGSWLWTNEGWYWDSSEPFAWAVYHYGRWVLDPQWGWVWVPGYEWAPAWVAWRFGAEAVGWAPLGPGVSVFVTSYPFIDVWWTFVPSSDFVGVPVQRVAFRPRDTGRWFRATSPAPPRSGPAPTHEARALHVPAWGGPARSFIEQRTGRPVVVERRIPAVRPGAGGGERAGAPERRPDGWGGRPEARPVWPASPGSAERGRPEAIPARPEGARPQLRPESRPRNDESRSQARPVPRGPEPRPQAAPAPRGGESTPRAWGGGRERGGSDRGGVERGDRGGGEGRGRSRDR